MISGVRRKRNDLVAIARAEREAEMQDEPTPAELIKVADFLRNEIAPVIKGHNAFKLRRHQRARLVTRQAALSRAGCRSRAFAGFAWSGTDR